MKKPIVPFLLVLVGLIFCLAHSTWAQTTVLPLNGITGLHLRGGMEVELKKGPAEMRLSGGEENLKNLELSIENGVLEISGAKKKFGMPVVGDKIIISLPSLESLKISGAAEVTGGGFDNETLFMAINGFGSAILDLNVKILKFDVSGTGNVELAGKAETVVINLSGAASIEAENYDVENMTLVMSGAGSAEVNVSKQLDVNISGVGVVSYKGEPEVLRKRISGAGKIEQL
ncbi:MAG: hypothetical protein C0424_12725 [Sphingobacteriaceae bacterium]|nr:hypothetical protein [Sphingobacteriaceae bacterium]